VTRLTTELLRLYGPFAAEAAPLAGTPSRVRAFALGTRRPATSWPTLAPVWHAVQSDLALPAPGIAVDGHGGFQLCFSLAAAVSLDEAHAFLDALLQAHVGKAEREGLERLMAWDPTPREVQIGQWSAFVARDLAPVFEDTPWLDIEPSAEGQAELLSALSSIPLADFHAALARCRPPDVVPLPPGQPLSPREFLLSVMNDASAPLALRVDAAKALLASPTPGVHGA
jgi:hypothetical protein